MKITRSIQLTMAVLTLEMPLQAGVIVAPGQAKSSTQVNTTLDGVRVFPNPWRADMHATSTITFDRMPPQSTVKIFTLSGHEIRTLAADNGGANWDRTNDSGDKVASGIYLYLASDPQGNQTKGKLAIIR